MRLARLRLRIGPDWALGPAWESALIGRARRHDVDCHRCQRAPQLTIANAVEQRIEARIAARRHVMQRTIGGDGGRSVHRAAEPAHR